jgi:hypothetical protein
MPEDYCASALPTFRSREADPARASGKQSKKKGGVKSARGKIKVKGKSNN